MHIHGGMSARLVGTVYSILLEFGLGPYRREKDEEKEEKVSRGQVVENAKKFGDRDEHQSNVCICERQREVKREAITVLKRERCAKEQLKKNTSNKRTQRATQDSKNESEMQESACRCTTHRCVQAHTNKNKQFRHDSQSANMGTCRKPTLVITNRTYPLMLGMSLSFLSFFHS